MTDDASGSDRGGDEDGTHSTPDGPGRDTGPDTDWHPDTRPITADQTDDPADEFVVGDDDAAGDSDRIELDLGGQETDDGQESDTDPNAPEPSSTPIEAGDPDLEHVLFVVLGAIAMVLVLVQLITIPL